MSKKIANASRTHAVLSQLSSVSLLFLSYATPASSADDGAFARTTKLFTPNAYAAKPKGRAGNVIGLAVIPPITAKSDGAERCIAELVGHIPKVNMVISLPPNRDPLYLFKFLKHLKVTGRKVDFLMLAGHGVQTIDDPDSTVRGINLGKQTLIPAPLDVESMTNEINQLEASGADPKKRDELCKKLNLIHDGSAALLPGTQLILHSCYAGNSDQNAMMKTFGTAFLGVNGGKVIGPKYGISSELLGVESDPQGFWATAGRTIVTRSLQIGKILKAKRYVSPGDAFIVSQFYTSMKVPAAANKKLTCCEEKDTWKKFLGLWRTAAGNVRVTGTNATDLKGTIVSIVPGCSFEMKAGDLSFKNATVKGDSLHSNNGYCYCFKDDGVPPADNCRLDVTLSEDGKAVSGSQSALRYHNGAKTWDGGSIDIQINWTKIGD